MIPQKYVLSINDSFRREQEYSLVFGVKSISQEVEIDLMSKLWTGIKGEEIHIIRDLLLTELRSGT